MTAGDGLTRRRVLALLGAGGALAAGGAAFVLVRDDRDADDRAAELEPALVALGEAVVALHPALLDGADDLVAGSGARADVAADPAAALRRLSEQIREDHTAGEVLDVHGWVLSRTECAVAALVASER